MKWNEWKLLYFSGEKSRLTGLQIQGSINGTASAVYEVAHLPLQIGSFTIEHFLNTYSNENSGYVRIVI